MNPGGSVKDRAAWGLVKWAEKNGKRSRWGVSAGAMTDSLFYSQARYDREAQLWRVPLATLVSAACRPSLERPSLYTYSPLGIGLAHVCRARGYKCVIYMPNVRRDFQLRPQPHALTVLLEQTQSQEKIDLLKMLGAEVYPVPGELSAMLKRCDKALTAHFSAVAFDNPENYNHRESDRARPGFIY